MSFLNKINNVAAGAKDTINKGREKLAAAIAPEVKKEYNRNCPHCGKVVQPEGSMTPGLYMVSVPYDCTLKTYEDHVGVGLCLSVLHHTHNPEFVMPCGEHCKFYNSKESK